MPSVVILTCEHASNRVPKRWARAFRGKESVLRTHRGYDLGAEDVAVRLARLLDAPLLVGTASRLVVDLNRSPSHPRLFSEFTRSLPGSERALILRQVYAPHRAAVERAVRLSGSRGVTVVHVAIHSFTPVLNGVRRTADVGLLFDPARARESLLCRAWRAALRDANGTLRVRLNYPYRGTSDGLTTALRRTHDGASYLGVEVELGNEWIRTPQGAREAAELLGATLPHVIERAGHTEHVH